MKSSFANRIPIVELVMFLIGYFCFEEYWRSFRSFYNSKGFVGISVSLMWKMHRICTSRFLQLFFILFKWWFSLSLNTWICGHLFVDSLLCRKSGFLSARLYLCYAMNSCSVISFLCYELVTTYLVFMGYNPPLALLLVFLELLQLQPPRAFLL